MDRSPLVRARHESELSIAVRTLSTGRRVAHVPHFRDRFVPDQSWESRARRKLPERVMTMRRRIDHIARHGFAVTGSTILEVGTGPGLDTRLLGGLTQSAIHTVDIRQPLRRESVHPVPLHAFLDASREPILPPFSDSRYRLLAMDGRQLAFVDGVFDLVMVKHTLTVMANWELAIEECLRVLRPGGLLAIAESPFTGLFGISRQGIVDVPWAHVYLTEPEFREVLPGGEPARATVLRNFRSASRLGAEALLATARHRASLVSETYGRETLPAPFFQALFQVVPELAHVGAERLCIRAFELLFRRL